MKKHLALIGLTGFFFLSSVSGQMPVPAAPSPASQSPALEAAPPPAPPTPAPAPASPIEAATPAAEPMVKTTVTPAPTGPIEVSADAGGKGVAVTTAEANQNLVSIQVDRAPLSEVVRAFTQLSGANIIMGTNGHELVSVSMKNVEWEPALRAILDSAGKTLVTKGSGIYVVGSKEDIVSEPITVETIALKFITATAIIPTVEKMLVGTNTGVSAIASANALIIKATPNNISDIRKTILLVDIPRDQVFIEAKFVELNDEAIKDLGINWTSLQGITLSATNIAASLTRSKNTLDSRLATQANSDQRVHGDGVNKFFDNNGQPSLVSQGPISFGGGPTYTPPSGSSSGGGSSGGSSGGGSSGGTITPGAASISGTTGRGISDTIATAKTTALGVSESSAVAGSEVLSAVLSASDFAMTLSALKQNIGATVVSNPRLLVASGQKAIIHVGDNVPYASKTVTQTGTGGSSGQSEVTKIETGIKLEVTPTVNSTNNVTLNIKPKLSSISGTVIIDGNPVPIETTREVDTEFNVESGRTVAIGGLVSDGNQERVSKIPLLGDIPIIGKYLFSHSHTDRKKSEVIIFVSVSIINAALIKDNDGIPSTGNLIHKFTTADKIEKLEEQRQREAEEKAFKAVQARTVDSKTGKKRRVSLFD